MIGIFDSGFGGLTIFREIQKTLPDYDYIYLGDSARAPYGGHSPELIYRYTREAVDFLFKRGCQLVIVACNTATAAALRRIQQEYLAENHPERRVLGVIRPVVEKAVHLTKTGRVGVIGTQLTISSNAFVRELEEQFSSAVHVAPHGKHDKKGKPIKLQIFQQACPLLVPLIEEGWDKKPETRRILRQYLRPLKEEQLDVLVLGCTHYPILIEAIRAVMGPKCLVMNPGDVVAASLKDYLKRHPEMEKRLEKNKKIEFLTTDEVEKFNRLGTRFFQKPVKSNKVSLVE